MMVMLDQSMIIASLLQLMLLPKVAIKGTVAW